MYVSLVGKIPGALNFIFGRYVRRKAPKWGSEELIFFFFFFCESKVYNMYKDLKLFNILRAYELKFEPNLGCRAENSSNF